MSTGRDPFSPLYAGTATPFEDDAVTGARRRIPARAKAAKPGQLAAETLGKAIVLTVLIEIISVVSRFKVAVFGAFLLSLAFLVGRRLVALAYPRPQPQPVYEHAADERVDRPFADMHRIEDRLSWASRDLEHFEITGGGFIATGPDEAAVTQRFEWVRQRVAFYGSTPGYWPVLEMHGLGELGRKLNDMSKQGRWEEMATAVSDDVVHLFAAVGTHQELAAAIEQRFGGFSHAVNVGEDVPRAVLEEVKRIPARFRGYRTNW